eukprot:jgi/Bigna1/59928/fgenesh1_kg.7_\
MAGPRAPMTRFSVPSRTACAAVPKRTIGGAKKTVAPPKKTVAPARKTVAPAKKTVAPARKTVAPAKKTVAPARKTVAPAKKTVAAPKKTVGGGLFGGGAKSAPAPAKKAAPTGGSGAPKRPVTLFSRLFWYQNIECVTLNFRIPSGFRFEKSGTTSSSRRWKVILAQP